jgi:hypothetical protein
VGGGIMCLYLSLNERAVTSGEILSKNANRKKGNANRNPSTFRMFSPLYFCSVGHIGKSFLCYPSFLNKPSIYK